MNATAWQDTTLRIIVIPSLTPETTTFIIDVAIAIGILIVGWLVSALAAWITGSLLRRTDLDNRLVAAIAGRSDRGGSIQVEKWASTIVFWILMIFTLSIFLERLRLPGASEPLRNLIAQVTTFLPRLFSAAILLAVAWVIATIVRLIVVRGLQTFRLDEKLNQQVSGSSTEQSQIILSDTLANTLYWFIFLLFLPLVLSALQLQDTLKPIQDLINKILLILPNIFGAIIIAAAGWLVAQVLRRIVTNLLAATGTDRIGARFGLGRTTSGQSLSWLAGTLVYVLVLIPTAIAALDTLKIEAISRPATSMLQQILNAIPQILTAGLILAVAFFIGQFISDLVTDILTGIGFNNIFYWLGIQPKPAAPAEPATPPTVTPVVPPFGSDPEATIPMSVQPTLVQPEPAAPARTPSEFVGILALVGIMLIGTIFATDVLKIPAVTAVVTSLTAILGQVVIGLVVFAVGLYLANLAFNIISSSGNRQARIVAQAARIAIIALVSAMALQQMGIASNIVNLAFGILFGAIAVAIALAFGLGGRDIAAEQAREWLASFKDENRP